MDGHVKKNKFLLILSRNVNDKPRDEPYQHTLQVVPVIQSNRFENPGFGATGKQPLHLFCSGIFNILVIFHACASDAFHSEGLESSHS